MCRSRLNPLAGRTVAPRTTRAVRGRGFTLLELLMAMGVTGLLTVVLAGLTTAVRTAREHVEGLDEATAQAQSALERIRHTVIQAGTYRAGGPTVAGLAVVTQRRASVDVPDTLVVWCGGRSGGLAAAEPLSRLPRVEELLVYAPDPADRGRLIEFAFPGDTATIDFTAAAFAATIRGLVASAGAEPLVLCDRLRAVSLSGSASPTDAGCVFFDLSFAPTSAELAGASPSTAAWAALPWAQGIVSGDSGLRQATVRIEIQVERSDAAAQPRPPAIPFFGSASCRYVYQP